MSDPPTAEYRSFQGCFDKLVNGVQNDVENVARKAFQCNLISRESLSNATNRHHDETYRTTKLLVKILCKIEQNSACFDRFATILENVPTLEKLSQDLTAEHEQQEGRCLSPDSSYNRMTDLAWDTTDSGGPHAPQQNLPNSATGLSHDFDLLISQCCESINSREITPKAFASIILCLNLFNDDSDLDESLVVDCKNDLQKASSNVAIIELVKPYMSFLNPEFLAHIIEYLGSDHDRKNFKRYLKALEEYCEITQVVLPCQSNEMPESEMGFQKVLVVMKTPTMNLKGVRSFQSKMAKILKLNVASLQFKTAGVHDVSPLACFFQLPNFACEKIFPLSNEQQRELKALGVNSLKCGEYSYENSAAQSLSDQVSDEEEIEIPCLGRPFRLGMFYDCRNDNLLIGNQMCEDSVIDTAFEESPCVSHGCEVLEDDSLETKALSLQLTTPLKLSLMSNLPAVQNISKSAKYWNDRCESKRQVRVCLKYTSTTVKKQLPTNNLIGYQQQVFEGATHVVTGVLYGFDAYCVFDHMLRENERFEDIHDNMLTMVKALSTSDSPYSSYNQTANDCRVYSDTEQPCTLQETVNLFRKLPSLSASKKPTPVPKKVWLYPLKKLMDNRCNVVTRNVSTSFTGQVQSTLEYLHHVEILANDLLNQYSVTFSNFQRTKSRVTKFTDHISNYRRELRKCIAKLLPLVREGTADESELSKVVEESSSSPFKYESLITWLEQVKEEISTLEMLMYPLQDVASISSRELQSITSEELGSDYVVCFAFHVALEDDPAISYMQSYLETKKVDQRLSETKKSLKWYTNTELMKKITSNIDRFKTFVDSNAKNKSTKFVLTSCTQSVVTQSDHPSSILLYKGTTCKIWEPPGPPGKPIVKEVTHNTIQLEWMKPTYGSQSVECYQVSYHPLDNPQDGRVITTNSVQEMVVTISELAAGTKYVFTVQSKCKVGVGGKRETSDPIETKTAPRASGGSQQKSTVVPISADLAHSHRAFTKPTATAITHNSVTLEWPLPAQNSEDIEYYIISYRNVDDSSKKWKRPHTTDSSERKEIISGLSPKTKYIFRVRPELEDQAGSWSEISDPIETKAPVCQPGKPTASAVTHDSITLQWDEPEHNSEEVESYIVRYRCTDDPNKKWRKGSITDSSERKLTITKLNSKTKYIFKVQPELQDDHSVCVESIISDPIETKPERVSHPVSVSANTGKPTATRVTHDSITLQWNTPESISENVESYNVRYRSLSDDPNKKWTKKMIEIGEEDITVTGLTPKTKYIFKIRPVLEDDFGAWSEVSDPIETKNYLSRFDKPIASNVTHDSIQLKLTKLEHGTEDTKCCTVFYRLAGSTQYGDWTRKTIDIIQEHVTVKELNRNTEYIFKILSKDGSEDGPESETSDPIRTNVTSPPSKPIVTAVTHNSITVKWSKPQHGCDNIKSYVVHYFHRKDIEKKRQMNTTLEEATITSLASLEAYVIVVQPVCKSGVGTKSEPSDPIMTKATSLPGKPVATKVTHDSVSLKWNPPSYSCENIDHYEVHYFSSSDQPELKRSSSTQLNICGLNYNTDYEFMVHPVCKNGEGSPSQLSDPIKTNPASPPGKPVASRVTHNSITLSWSKPEYGCENGTNYLILCRRKNMPDSEKWKVLKTSSVSTNLDIKEFNPTTEYLFKVKLVCQRGESNESEVSDPIKTEPVCKPGKPYATKVTQDSIILTWEIPKHNTASVEAYKIISVVNETRSNKPEFMHTTKAQSHGQSSEKESLVISNLTAGTGNMFKVVPLGSDVHCIYTESEPSDLIVTKVTSAPGTPKIVDVTNDTAVVKWTHPVYGKENILHYTVCYRSATDPSSGWKYQNTRVPQISQVITGLSMKTKYLFTVVPKCKDGKEGTGSETSTIETAATSPPGVPEVTKVTYEQISLKWTPPDIGGESVSSYRVYYRQLEQKQWREQTTAENGTYVIIGGLDTNKYYKFKVRALCKPECGIGAESKQSEPVLTSKCCVTGKPKATVVTHNSIELQWDRPLYGCEHITCYEVSYRIKKLSVTWNRTRTTTHQLGIVISGLPHNTEHIFRVRPICEGTDIHAPFCTSDYIRTDDKPLAERMLDMCSKSDCLVKTGIKVYRIPNRRQDMKNEFKKIAKYHIGTPVVGTHERVIMLVGATGAGKSTLINSIANYILGVSSETPFRFKLIEDEKSSQAHSQTSWITAYTFHAQKGSPISYDITIVDTPGFGDTRGIERDKEITRHIKEFFSLKPPNGIDSIYAIGFVAQAALARLTPTQKYVFDSILAMFGKDIADNIFLMATFADGQPPQVLAAIKEAEIKCKECFKFNNSVLYPSTNSGGEFNQLFWEMNAGNIKSFFKILETTPAISLQLTKEVLQKREHLEALINGLQEKIRLGLNLIQETQQEEKIMKDLNVFDPNFTYEVDVVKTKRIPLPEGTYVTNCTQCNFTCHFPCTISDDGKKYNCASMEGSWLRRGKDSKCKVCPSKCHWSVHKQNDYRIEIYTEKEKRNLQDLMKRYLDPSESVSGDSTESVADKMLSSAREKLKALNKDVLDLIKETQRCMKRLHEIAFKPHPLDEAAYIDLMIESEKTEGREGFAGRVNALEELKKQARILSRLRHSNSREIESQNWWALATQK